MGAQLFLHKLQVCLATCLSASLLLLSPLAAQASQVRVGGTGNSLGTMQLIANAYNASRPGGAVTLLPSMGSTGAIKAVANDAIEIGLSSRPLSAEEAKSGLQVIEYARTPTVFAVSNQSKVKAITLSQLVDIYAGKLSTWPDGTQIRPILRQPSDDNTQQIMKLSPAMEAAVRVSENKPGFTYAFTDQEAADKIASIPGALGVSTLALILSEKRPMRALTLDGVDPTPQNISIGRYPLLKNFYLIVRSQPDDATQSFIQFVKSPRGTSILRQNGHFVP